MTTRLEEIRAINERAWALSKKDSPEALRLARQVEDLLSTCDEARPEDKFQCLKTQTYCLDILSRPGEAIPVGIKANLLAENIGDPYLIGSIQSLLGRIYWHIDDFPTSMDYYLNALKIVQSSYYPDLEISLINGLGLVQYGLENYPESLKYFKICLEKAAEDDLTGRADANNNIAYVLHVLGRDQEALEYGLAGLALFRRLGTSVGMMETLHSVGAINFSLGNYEQALACLQEGIQIARQNDNTLLEISYILEISRIYQVRGNLDQAEDDLHRAFQMAESINSLTNISLIHEHLAEIYKNKQDFRSALEQFEAFHATYKKVFNDRSDRRVKNLEILHQVEITRKQSDLYRELAGTDFLTGLINRRHFREIAENALERAESEKRPFAVIMLDIDHFKRVNDTYGHKAGDEVLASVADTLKKSLRQDDVAGRYGGEEFIVLLSCALPEICFSVAERIRQAIAQQSIPIGQETIHVSISLGLALYQLEQKSSLDDLINRADQAMYLAKGQGRNRVVAWTANLFNPKPSSASPVL